MVFSSVTFIYVFLPLVLLLYYIIPVKYMKARNIVLLISSLFFYSFQTPVFLPIMLGCMLLTYINGRLIEKYGNKFHYIASIILCLIPLIIFKYIDFFISNVNYVTNKNFPLLKLTLPLGISFYTFQMLSYLIDVKRKTIEAERNFFDLALYISFFPQLVAGPIVKYSDVKIQLHGRNNTIQNFSDGIMMFVVGLGKKVLIANQLGEFCSLYDVGDTTIVFTWLYMAAYSLQVYFDFSGYSTMALGLGKMFGFELVENFNYPYISSNIKEFWKRWHITLSSFFKEYVYIPLGGSRCSKIRTVFNLFVVWFLTGFWHGADWNFICWGLYFFVLLLIEKFLVSKLEIKKWMKPFQHIVTLFLLGVSFIIFGASNMSSIFVTIQHLFAGTFFDNNTWFELRNNMVLLIISMVGATPLLRNIYTKLKDTKYGCIVEPIYIICILMLSTAYLIDGSYNPFLYFRF